MPLRIKACQPWLVGMMIGLSTPSNAKSSCYTRPRAPQGGVSGETRQTESAARPVVEHCEGASVEMSEVIKLIYSQVTVWGSLPESTRELKCFTVDR